MTATRAQVIEAARGWVGTPWHHQGRTKGVGADCVGLIVGALAAVGVQVEDFTWYRRAPEGDALLREVAARFARLDAPEPGCLLVFFMRHRRVAQHVGLLTFDGTIIHGSAGSRVVCEQAYDAAWQHRTLAAFDVTRGPADG